MRGQLDFLVRWEQQRQGLLALSVDAHHLILKELLLLVLVHFPSQVHSCCIHFALELSQVTAFSELQVAILTHLRGNFPPTGIALQVEKFVLPNLTPDLQYQRGD